MKTLISLVLLTSIFATRAACPQESAAVFPCENDERFAEFDFWVGEWNVHIPSGEFAGSNVITSSQRGCVLIENWTSATGGTGMSINYLDHEAGEWVQIWSDGSGSQINIRGGLTDEGMLLVGTIHYVASNMTERFRGLWTPLEDGRVRQFFEHYDAASDSWKTWFDGYYSRKSADDDG